MSTNSTNTKRRIGLEAWLTNVIAGFVPWLAPVPSAALVANATQKHLKWTEPIAVIAGVIIEGLGLTSTSTALTLWDFNARKDDREQKAPFGIAALLVGVYFVSTIALTVVLDANSGLTQYAPAIFPILAIVATVNIALRSQHTHRLERIAAAEEAARIAAEKVEEERKRAEAEAKADAERKEAERKAERELRRLERKEERKAKREQASIDGSIDETIDRLQAGRAAKKMSIIDAMLNAYRVNPHVGDTELGGMVGVTRQTVYNYRTELEAAGRIHKNGNGIEVL